MAASAAPDASARSVDFYVLPGSEARARLKLACRLAEKAYLAYPRVLVWSDDASELASFDELLWTFAERSFVPHELYSDPQQWRETPVLLSCQGHPPLPFDVLLNLGTDVPEAAAHAARIIEIIDADQRRVHAGRERFRRYRDQGLTPRTHHIAADRSSEPI